MARRNERMSGTILCANSTGDKQQMIRVAVLVKRGKIVERVVIVDVERRERTTHAVLELAKEKAMFPRIGIGTQDAKIVASAYDGGIFTGLGQPVDEPRIGSVSR